jgi:hypothetical protein
MAVALAGEQFTGLGIKVIRWERENIEMFLFPHAAG